MESGNYVGRLNEYAHKKRFILDYRESPPNGPDHCKTFTQRVVLNGIVYPEGVGKTKKEARKDAAKNALSDLSEGTNQTADDNYNPTSAQQKKELNQNDSDICNKTRSLSVNSRDNSSEQNFIGLVNHYCQTKKRCHSFVEVKRDGPAHIPQFFYRLIIDNKEYPVAEGRSAKEARQNAARLTWSALKEQTDWDSKVSVRSTLSEDGAPPSSSSSILLESHEASSQSTSASTSCSIKFTDTSNPSRAQMPLGSENGAPSRLSTSLKSLESSQSMSSGTSGSEIFTDSSNSSNDQHAVKKKTSTPSRFTSDFDPIEYLGIGGYGSVYKARRKLEEKYYAVKIVRSDKKAFREVGTLSDLLHHNVIRYFNCWIEDTRYEDGISAGSSAGGYSDAQSTDDPSVKFLYIQMELCKTKTLKEWINEKNTQSPQDTKRRQESLTIAQQIVSGVEYIHSKGHIHRDLKPDNILFGLDDKEVKIGDFGLVTRDDDALMDRTENRGTRSYMAPEQVGKTYDRKVDIFALGLIYLELLWKVSSGHERGEVLQNARKQILPTDFSRAFQEENLIIKKMLHEKPEVRPKASDLKAQLDKLAQTENEPQKRATV
ncbi:hypothetical protein NQZ68_022946 [Dissostichus eleginoides]|nr:hypothetical protein NQZ68_022946 [Dissostichus eleginoides]